MRRSIIRSASVGSIALLATLFLVGCGSKDTPASKSAKWEGTYDSQKDKMVLVLQADHKGSMSMDGKPADMTWDVASDDKITISPFGEFFRTSDGNLRDDSGQVWKRR